LALCRTQRLPEARDRAGPSTSSSSSVAFWASTSASILLLGSGALRETRHGQNDPSRHEHRRPQNVTPDFTLFPSTLHRAFTAQPKDRS